MELICHVPLQLCAGTLLEKIGLLPLQSPQMRREDLRSLRCAVECLVVSELFRNAPAAKSKVLPTIQYLSNRIIIVRE